MLGSSEPGMLGDLVVLSADDIDPKNVPVEAIKSLKAVMTVVDGRVVYEERK